MLILIVQCLLSIALVGVLTKLFTKTDLDNIPGPKSESLVKGNFGQLFSVSAWNFNAKIAAQCNVFFPYNTHSNLNESQHLYLFDPKAMHHIIVKDQTLYEETEAFFAANNLLFGCGLTSTQGDHHKKQRKLLNPVFSTVHMRHMSKGLTLLINSPPATSKLLFQREYILPTVVKIGSPQFRRWLLDLLPFRSLRTIRDMIDILDRTTTEIYETKKQAMKEGVTPPKQSSEAKDLISILMKANIEAPEEDRLPDKEVLAQMSLFVFAATDTTSNALSRTLHLLAMNPEIQDKLRVEVTEALKEHNGDIPYDDLVSLPFMDAVCRETLRLYPPAPRVMRVHVLLSRARKDMILPLSTPVKGLDGREMQSILVPKNTKIFISIFNANRDPLLWGPDSLEWKPERWLSPLPEAVHDVLTIRSNVEGGLISLSMTFLGGGRACIGFEFSQLEMKVVLSMLIANFRFFPPEKEIIWKMTPVTTPTVAESPAYPQLPLKMEVISPKPVL
ncbi:Cytochrome P450 4F12 [Termitomyces sp. J132]|nr:Cytochrome P450 4F12 [Termitomyces sp. J132]